MTLKWDEYITLQISLREKYLPVKNVDLRLRNDAILIIRKNKSNDFIYYCFFICIKLCKPVENKALTFVSEFVSFRKVAECLKRWKHFRVDRPEV